MSQIFMFDDECSSFELLFRNFGQPFEQGERYILTVKSFRDGSELAGVWDKSPFHKKEVAIVGDLLLEKEDEMTLSNVFVGCKLGEINIKRDSFELVKVFLDDVVDVKLFPKCTLEVYKPYRLVLNEKESDDRRQKWLSVQYVGQMQSGYLMFLDYNKDKELVFVMENELKKVYPMNVKSAKDYENALLEGKDISMDMDEEV